MRTPLLIHSKTPPRMVRLIPSRFPPIGMFDTVATAGDLRAVIDLAGWTNDRLSQARLARLSDRDLGAGRSNASVIIAAFMHYAPNGARFNGPDLGGWYAADGTRTAVTEVAHHLRRELNDNGKPHGIRDFREYACQLHGDYVDIRGGHADYPELYRSDDYTASQVFGEKMRATDEDGILYTSLRYANGINVVAYRPRNILNVTQTNHYRITVTAATNKIEVQTVTIT